MNHKEFMIPWFWTTLFSVVGVWVLSLWELTAPHASLGWFSILLFSILSLIIYILGKRTVDHQIRTRFISVTIANMMLKMFFSMAIVLVYYKMKSPESPYFIIPFIFIYVIYTIFETRILLKLADQKKER